MKFTTEDKQVVAANEHLPPSKRTIPPSVDSFTSALALIATGPFALQNSLSIKDKNGVPVNRPNVNAPQFMAELLAGYPTKQFASVADTQQLGRSVRPAQDQSAEKTALVIDAPVKKFNMI